jgi:general secretion pathway protein D
MQHPSPLSCPRSALRATALALALMLIFGDLVQAQTNPAHPAGAAARGAPVTLNFVNAEIEAVARASRAPSP